MQSQFRYYVVDVEGFNNHFLTYATNKKEAVEHIRADIGDLFPDKYKATAYRLEDFTSRHAASISIS